MFTFHRPETLTEWLRQISENRERPTERDVLEGVMWGYSGLHAVHHLAGTGILPDPSAEARMAAGDPPLTLAYAGFPGDPGRAV